MREIYIFESDRRMLYSRGNLIVRSAKKEKLLEISLDKIKSISIFSNPHITINLLKALGLKGVEVHFFGRVGTYMMSMNTCKQENYEKQEKQFEAIRNKNFSLHIAQLIIKGKIKMQKNLLKAYNTDDLIAEDEFLKFDDYMIKVTQAKSIDQILGYEGKSARMYFYYLGLLVPDEFRFHRRSKRPPRDPFNALISFGYSVLYGYIRGALIRYGLNIGIGCLHQTRGNHAALASDLMEVWRPILIDDTVMKLLHSNQISINQFEETPKGSILMDNESRELFLNKLRERMLEKHFYFGDSGFRFVFLHSVNQQIESLQRAFETKDSQLFRPIGVNRDEII